MLDDVTPKKAVEFAVKTEELGQAFYTKLARRFDDNPVVREIFTILAREEEWHKKAFEQLLGEVSDDGWDLGAERGQYLRAMSISEFFDTREGLMSRVDQVKDRNDALLKALDLERATVAYYQAMREAMKDREVVDKIIGAEKKHVTGLLKYIMTDAEVRGLPESVDAEDFR